MDSSKSRLLKSWHPLILSSQLLGLSFFTVKIPKIGIIIYRALILTLLVIIVIDQIPIILYWTVLQANIVDKTLQIIKISIAWINYFVDFLLAVLRNRDICQIMDGLTGMDLKLPQKVYGVTRCRQILFLALHFFVLCLYQILSVPLSPVEIRKGHSSTAYIFINSIILVNVAQFFELVLLIREYYKCLNLRIVKLKDDLITDYGATTEITSCKEINELRIIHFSLHDISTRVNESYQIQLLLVLIRCFVEITSAIVSLIVDDVSQDFLLSYVFKLSNLMFKFMLVVDICYCCHVAVGESRSIVAQISFLSNSAKFEAVRNEIKLFSIQTLQIPLKFSIFTFFNLNMELLTKMVISISSYIIIIYTFETSHEDEN